MIKFQLAVASQGMKQPLNISFEDAMNNFIIRFVQMLPSRYQKLKEISTTYQRKRKHGLFTGPEKKAVLLLLGLIGKKHFKLVVVEPVSSSHLFSSRFLSSQIIFPC